MSEGTRCSSLDGFAHGICRGITRTLSANGFLALSLSWAGLPQKRALKVGSSIGLGGGPREDEKGSTKVIQEEKGASYHHRQLELWVPQVPSLHGKGVAVGWDKDLPSFWQSLIKTGTGSVNFLELLICHACKERMPLARENP